MSLVVRRHPVLDRHAVNVSARPGPTPPLVNNGHGIVKKVEAYQHGRGQGGLEPDVALAQKFLGDREGREAQQKPAQAGGKGLLDRMFGWMMPKGPGKLALSNMHMMGMGTSMMKGLMKKKHVASLGEMFKTAGELGVHINICEMSMDLMGFKKEEMIDYPNLTICGVATFLADASESKIQLFI